MSEVDGRHTFCLKCMKYVADTPDLDWFIIDCEELEAHSEVRRIKCCGCGGSFDKEPE